MERPPEASDEPTVPSPARVWNYFVGGKDNYASDRALAEKIMESVPEMSLGAKLTRKFIQRAVEELITEYGIRQFLDIGSGLPTADNTHEVAQRLAPDSRIVYVDNDPVVIRHAEALLNSTPEGACAYIEEDLRHPESILSGAARTLSRVCRSN